MSKLIFILGGARSGKSSFASRLAKGMGKEIIYLATAEIIDEEMAERIVRHKAQRPREWQTIEEPRNLKRIKRILGDSNTPVLIDCLTLLLSNIILSKANPLSMRMGGIDEEKLVRDFSSLADAVIQGKSSAIFVANEVGLGICPEHYLGRLFRDIAGRINQEISKKASEVYFLLSGIPQRIK